MQVQKAGERPEKRHYTSGPGKRQYTSGPGKRQYTSVTTHTDLNHFSSLWWNGRSDVLKLDPVFMIVVAQLAKPTSPPCQQIPIIVQSYEKYNPATVLLS